ncbi:substrate-binding domain-containing protein [Streptomyces sp. NEAU-S7GS2]|uniref:sugar ABC transporter substrate-binding protein n=1 Tax=Streptomyces sp. NEAU-S7GS2 TaxID=2202000 RepID=UPI001EF477AD|nr:substrate-binding domain-containing protein [Streptomyces sp. NEAU-S7GS2]
MNARLRGAAALLAGVCMVAGPAACGEAGGARESNGSASGGAPKIGVLLPDNTSRLYHFDKPLIEKKIHRLCPECTVETVSAQHDVATQQQQMDAMITKQVQVLILDAVDSKSLRSSVESARRAGIPVVAYDRLVEGPVSAYVSFNGETVGRLQGEALLKALGPKARDAQIVMMNGASTDPNSAWFKQGALAALKGKVKIAKAYETGDWRPENANRNMSAALSALGADHIDGVYSANDGLAAGIIAALQAAKVAPLPPITGQDAELAAIQRLVKGDQIMTVYKPFAPEAGTAAAMAVALGRGEKLRGITTHTVNSPTNRGIPAVLLTPVSVNVHNIKNTVVKDGMYTIDQICTPKFESACKRAGLLR